MHGYAPNYRAAIGGVMKSPRLPHFYTLNAGGTLAVPSDDTSTITYTGGTGTTATVIVSGQSYTVRNSSGVFPCGMFVWDYLGPQQVPFSQVGQVVARSAGLFNFLVQWDGCGSHIFEIVPLGFVSAPSLPVFPLYFSSAWATFNAEYFSSPWTTTGDIHYSLPGGFLVWTNRLPDGTSELHGVRTSETVSGPMDESSPVGITKINADDAHRIEGGEVLSPPYKSPSVYSTPIHHPRVLSVSNGVPMFLFDEVKQDERRLDISSQYAPKAISSHSHREDGMSAVLYLESGNIYFFTGDDEDYSMSSSSSESSESSSSISSFNSSSSSSSSASTSSKNSSSSSSSSASTSSRNSSSSLGGIGAMIIETNFEVT